MRSRLCLFIATAGLLLGGATHSMIALAGEESGLVQVTATSSPISSLTPMEIRKAYLGVAITVNGETVQPLRNASDPILEEAFLQKVLFMSRESYERLLLTKVMHGGSVRPAKYDSEAQLLNVLSSNRAAITYMWTEKASAKPGIKVVAELWQASK